MICPTPQASIIQTTPPVLSFKHRSRPVDHKGLHKYSMSWTEPQSTLNSTAVRPRYCLHNNGNKSRPQDANIAVLSDYFPRIKLPHQKRGSGLRSEKQFTADQSPISVP